MPDPAAEPQGAGDDLRADITGAWDAQEPTPSAPTGADVATSPSAGVAQPSAPPSEVPAGGERARNPDGTFAKGAKPEAAVAQPAGAAQPGVAGAQPAAAPAATGFKIPEKWPADVKARLAEIHKVNPDHAQFLLDEYGKVRAIAAQHHQKSQEYLKGYEQFLAPGRQDRALRGIDDGMHIRHLLAADDFMTKSPEQGLRWLAQQYGIDLKKLGDPQAGGEPEIPPYVAKLQQEVQQLRQATVQQARGAEEQQLRAASDLIDSFANQKDASGQPLYPYFDEVIQEVLFGVQYQMHQGQQIDLKAAYDRAVWMNDSVRLKDQRARSEATSRAAAAQRQREIEDAKRAGVTVSGSGADTTHAPGSVREELLRAFDKAG